MIVQGIDDKEGSMAYRLRGSLFALVLALVMAAPLAAQNATPTAEEPGQHVIDLPEARLLALSPDGQWLAAGNPQASRPKQLCIYEVATRAERVCGDLSGLDAGIRLDDVVWSPDSTRLAFGENAFQVLIDGDLWMMDATTGEVTNLTDDGVEGRLPLFGRDDAATEPIFIDLLPAWAPDSQSITFSRSPILNGGFRGNQIVRIDLATNAVETLFPVTLDVPGVVYFGMTWNPSGDVLSFSIMHPSRTNPANGAYEYDPATGASRRIAETDPELGPPAIMEVNAGGEWAILFYPLAATQFVVTSPVYALLNLATGDLRPLEPQGPGEASAGSVRLATFSPDGTRLLMGLVTDNQTGTLLIRDLADGAEQIAAVDLPRIVMQILGRGLTWATNGTTFVPTDLSSGVLVRLTASAPPPAPPSPSP
jgi:Tol biopolymer transport system component